MVSAGPGESHPRQPARSWQNSAVHRGHAVWLRRAPGRTQADNTAKFGKDLIEDVIPYIDDSYRTLANRTNRAIVGLSMGGGQSLSIGLNNIELFSYVGGFSAAIGNAANLPKTYAKLADNAGSRTAS